MSKIIPTFEDDVLMPQVRVSVQVFPQTCDVTRIEQFYGATKCGIFDPLMVRQIEPIGKGWFFDVPFQSRPARKSILASDCELSVTKAWLVAENFSVRSPIKTWMKFSEPLGHPWVAGSVIPQQVFRLIFQMIEVRIRWEASYGHDELPFVSPRSAFTGRK